MIDHELINHPDVVEGVQKIINAYNEEKKEDSPNRTFIIVMMFYSEKTFDIELKSNCKKLQVPVKQADFYRVSRF